jgi:hypothetical protein
MCSRDRGPGEHVGCPVGFTWVTLTGDDATAVLRWLRSTAEARRGFLQGFRLLSLGFFNLYLRGGARFLISDRMGELPGAAPHSEKNEVLNYCLGRLGRRLAEKIT